MMTYLSYLDENSDITDITWRNRRRFAPLDTFCEDIMRGASELSTAEKELIAAYVSGLNACQFCFGAHKAVAANFGVEAEIIEQLVADIDSTKFSEKLKVILRFAKKLTQEPSKVVKIDVDAILNQGWKEQTVEDVIAVVGLFNFYNRLLDGHGIKGNAAIFAFGGAHLSARGYKLPWFVKLIQPLIKKQKQRFIDNFRS